MGLDFTALIRAVEGTSPFLVPTALQAYCDEPFGGPTVTFWIADYSGYSLERLDNARPREAVSIATSDAGRALRTQELVVMDDGRTVHVPVSVRGEAVGVLAVALRHEPSEDELLHLQAIGHAFAYIVASTRRHTDLFEWGQRSRDLNVAAEIQRRLLPAFTCECWPITLAGWVEPAFEAGGDTFDYTVDDTGMTVTLTDAMGHGISAALVATLTTGVLRNERRRSSSVAAQVAAANATLFERSRDDEYVTGVFLDLPTDGRPPTVITAGHPVPWRLRDGVAGPVHLEQAMPLGLFAESAYVPLPIDFQPGDRLLLVSDGVVDTLEGTTTSVADLLVSSADLHPREAVQVLTSTVVRVQGGSPRDDATAVCIEWYRETDRTSSSAGSDAHASAPLDDAAVSG
jgi:serine phosphatase RsbU (regulator of sigma subunit)